LALGFFWPLERVKELVLLTLDLGWQGVVGNLLTKQQEEVINL